MVISAGTSQYQLGSPPVTGIGISYSKAELNDALSGDVAAAVFDHQGKADIKSMLDSSGIAGFSDRRIGNILSDTLYVPHWRVGEALAEVYMAQHRRCLFPWTTDRDIRRDKSSLPGADLVGFLQSSDKIVFAFGEIKTSTEAAYPPRVMFGETGLQHQLKLLQTSEQLRNLLVRYLGNRAVRSEWEADYQRAAYHYLQNNDNVFIFGFLVRDVPPNKQDLQQPIVNLAENLQDEMEMELVALYLPQDSIAHLQMKILEHREGEIS